ncbi:MAG: ATP-binding protein [Rickettsiales bacterium]|nr:ATP-binding protein [Pseudomonadota bacterium]MDA0966336.1 ATP-binding protein [Pseudomonadota bacterium]MDG4543968.1 ATP-binding protein [Rickettsiales bacterium]MDG4545462.1 ATP-binding protein [Rickettsiales bacterium]MDG4547911.1 ATP-binding protein [Rickettsiales bacterium]
MNLLKSKIATLKKVHEKKRRVMEAYYDKLLKASLIISIVPNMGICLLVLYNRLSLLEGILSGILVFLSSMLFAKPYLDDLSSLTAYVDDLTVGRITKPPQLSFINNVEQLSKSVLNLQRKWGEKAIELEAALAESSILFDTIPDVLLMIDKDLNILRANNAAINSFRRGVIVTNLKDMTEDECLIKCVGEVLKRGYGDTVEITMKSNNKAHDFLVMVEKFPVQSIAGISAVIIMHDITEEKRRKQLLKDFVANASHEIRTPLTSVMGFLENLKTLDEEEDNVEIRRKTRKKFFEIMTEQTNRMAKLLNDLLSLSKAEMNAGDSLSEPVNVESVVREVVNRLKHLADEKKIKIKIDNLQDSPIVLGSYDELSQVFTNIVSNAIKYGKDKSKIEISKIIATDFSRSFQMPKNCKKLLLISVKDEGEGISEQHLPRITERFYRVDKLRSRKVGGTGLGLAITKHILYRHCGDLVVESKLGVGSTFTVRLPVQ